MSNPVKVVTQYLEEYLAIDADSGDELYSHVAMDRLPPDFENDTPAISVQHQAGRPATSQAPVSQHQIAIKCFGGSDDDNDAWAVHERVYEALQNAVDFTSGGNLVFAELATVSKYYEPDLGWPVVLAVYQVETT